jgi:PAS domain S-box-containing protein
MKYFSWKFFAVQMLVSLTVVSISVLILYNTTVNTEIDKLQALSQSHAKLIGSVAQHDLRFSKQFANGGARGATLFQISNAHFEKIGFGETGEFVVGENRNGKIHFHIPSRNLGGSIPPVDLDAKTAEPMRRALFGQSGVMHAPDYRGEEVLAWYEPLPDLNAGFVVKINIAEIRTPFKLAISVAVMVGLILSVFGTFIFGLIRKRYSDNDETELHSDRASQSRSVLYISFISCLSFSGLCSVATIIALVVVSGTERQKSELVSLSAGMASLIEAVATFDAMSMGSAAKSHEEAAQQTFSQIKQSAKTQPGFGETGEIVFGVLSDNKMEFLLPSRFTGIVPPAVEFVGTTAEPMRQALSGKSGIIADLDYRREVVLAAFQPVKSLNAGLVAKMAEREIRQPYVLTAIINISLTIFVVLFGTLMAPHIVSELAVSHVGGFNVKTIANNTKDKTGTGRRSTMVFISSFTALIFLLDYLTPLGIAGGVPYIALLIAAAYFLDRKGIIVLTCVATLLVFAGWFIAPDSGAAFWKVLTNRLYAVFTVWLAAFILLRVKAAEEEQREGHKQMVALLEAAPDATIVVGKNGKITYSNRQAEILFDYSKSDFDGMSVEQLVPLEIRDGHAAKRGAFFDHSSSRAMGANMELYGLDRSGIPHPVEISLSPIEIGTNRYAIASIRDVSARKEAQEELTRKEAQLRMTLDNMPGAIFVVDENLDLVLTNDQYAKIYGHPDGLMAEGKSMVDVLRYELDHGILVGDGDPDAILKKRLDSFRNIKASSFEDRTPDGRYTQLTRKPAPGGQIVTVVTEITDRKKAERIIADAMALIHESIQYASRIQRSVLPTRSELSEIFDDHFVIWEPKDVVGGDFYLTRKRKGGALILVADCTGHGVPGAFMTMIATGAFDQAIIEKVDGTPGELLERTNQLVKMTLGQYEGAEGESDDGFECGLCLIDDDEKKITFAGARFELWCVKDDALEEIKGDKVGIGYRRTSEDFQFSNRVIAVEEGASYYITSDGLVDQIGGEKKRAYGKRRLKTSILTVSRMKMSSQAAHILREFQEYQHHEVRRDDITLVGFKPKH